MRGRVDARSRVPLDHVEYDSVCACLQSRRRREFRDELPDPELSTVANVMSHPKLTERSVDQIAKR